ncbi:MAG: class I SAM-dependent RNA methyltransferase, partial [Deltaproteobacteria bacterium]|nr:class I SAM-dependent RNA methyltransferase [Deltaproteobacteria bacterium]
SERDKKTTANFYLREKEHFDWVEALKDIRHLKGFEVRVGADERSKGESVLRQGDTGICYEAAGLEFKADLNVFTQTNHIQNQRLVQKVVEYADLKGGERVLDLFSGVGNLTLPLALDASHITGVEDNNLAVGYARDNVRLNNSEGVVFIREKASLWLKEQSPKDLENPLFDVVVLDPPRGGGPDTVRLVQRLSPKRIVYVSCNPPTLARDISWLNKNGYIAKRACLVDIFPRTHHMEAIISLEKK